MASKHTKESNVRQHMQKIGNSKVQCRLCLRQLYYVGGSTSSLKHHLNAMHPDVMSVSTPTQPTLSSFGVGIQRQCTDSKQKITALLTKVTVANMLPLSLVDNAEFCELMAFIEPNYKVPCRQTLTHRMESTKSEVAKSVSAELESASAVSITTDRWTSISNDAYLSFTTAYITPTWELKARTLANTPMDERHIQSNIAAQLLDVAKSWSIDTKIMAVMHDGASNMKKSGSLNNWVDTSCAAHKLHLAVMGTTGIDKVTNSTLSKCISAASHLVGHFLHSPLAANELNKCQLAMAVTGENGQPLKLVQYVKTTLNSIYDMFERLVKLRWLVIAVLSL